MLFDSRSVLLSVLMIILFIESFFNKQLICSLPSLFLVVRSLYILYLSVFFIVESFLFIFPSKSFVSSSMHWRCLSFYQRELIFRYDFELERILIWYVYEDMIWLYMNWNYSLVLWSENRSCRIIIVVVELIATENGVIVCCNYWFLMSQTWSCQIKLEGNEWECHWWMLTRCLIKHLKKSR